MMNGLPFIQSAENVFYLENGPAYLDRPVGSAPTSNTASSKPQQQNQARQAKIGFNKAYLIPGGTIRFFLLAS